MTLVCLVAILAAVVEIQQQQRAFHSDGQRQGGKLLFITNTRKQLILKS